MKGIVMMVLFCFACASAVFAYYMITKDLNKVEVVEKVVYKDKVCDENPVVLQKMLKDQEIKGLQTELSNCAWENNRIAEEATNVVKENQDLQQALEELKKEVLDLKELIKVKDQAMLNLMKIDENTGNN